MGGREEKLLQAKLGSTASPLWPLQDPVSFIFLAERLC